jgi:hypothetical protein
VQHLDVRWPFLKPLMHDDKSNPPTAWPPLAPRFWRRRTLNPPTAWPPLAPRALAGGAGGGGGEGRPRVRLFGSGSPVEIRLFGFSPEGGTSLPVVDLP